MSRLSRRTFLNYVSLAGAASLVGCQGSTPPAPPSATSTLTPAPLREFPLVAYPEKLPLRLLTDRPPQLETPLEYYKHDLTPNEAFYVRWHMSGIQTSIDVKTYRLKVTGQVEKPMEFSLDDLRKKFEEVSVVAVNQCSGNQRSLFEPHPPGGQWIHGAVGCAKWTGVRLKDILAACKPTAKAVDVSYHGSDKAPMTTTPAFAKCLSIEHANDGEVIIAYAMNDKPLPILNGFPLRLVVPGWYATYWVKALTDLEVLDHKFDGYWVKTAYQIPDNPDVNEAPDALAKDTVPIHRMLIHSFLISQVDGDKVPVGKVCALEGLATHGGGEIKTVEVSTDGGKTWTPAQLGPDLGKYAWRRWKLDWTPTAKGPVSTLARATNAAGETQKEHQWNRSGFARNMIETVKLEVV